MPQLSLYVDDATMETLRAAARGEGVSMSKYAAGLIRAHAEYGGWPEGYWDSVYGCLTDDELAAHASGGNEVLDPALDDACDWFTAADHAAGGR